MHPVSQATAAAAAASLIVTVYKKERNIVMLLFSIVKAVSPLTKKPLSRDP